MAFEGLSGRLSEVFKKLKGRGKVKESDIKEVMREVRMALLEADVNYKVAKDFVAIGRAQRPWAVEVLESLTPAQQVIKIVNDELTDPDGFRPTPGCTFSVEDPHHHHDVRPAGLPVRPPTVPSWPGTFKARAASVRCWQPATSTVRLRSSSCRWSGNRPDVPVFEMGQGDPVEIARKAVLHARDYGNDLVILDTAGRLHIDEELMEELRRIKEAVQPQEILLVVDAMTGQDAVNVAKSFDETLGIDGAILTKLDGDTRGGAALSVRAVTGKPIKFVGTGEKLDNLEPFYPDRMASRILGMGDVLTLIEKAQEHGGRAEGPWKWPKKLKEQQL